jgi:hypothetical protein
MIIEYAASSRFEGDGRLARGSHISGLSHDASSPVSLTMYSVITLLGGR